MAFLLSTPRNAQHPMKRLVPFLIVSVLAFGQKPMSETNRTSHPLDAALVPNQFTGAAIQASIDALASSGGIVQLQPGTYTITSTINMNKANVCLIGAGKGSGYGGTTGATTLNVAAGVTGIDITGTRDCVGNLFLYSQSTRAGTDDGIRVRGPGSILFNLAVKNFGYDGVTCDSS